MPSARPPAPAHPRQPGHTSASRSKNPRSERSSQNRQKTLQNHLTDSVLRWWLAKFGDAAAEANPGQLLEFVLPLAASGHQEAEGWLTKVNRAHPSPPPGLDALAHGTWAAYYLNRGSVGLALEHNRLARQAVSAAAGQGPLFPMLTELPIQAAGAHLLAGDLAAAAAALQHGTAPLSAPIVDEFRTPIAQAWAAFLQGDLVSAGAALDRAVRAAAEYHAVAHGYGLILASLAAAGIRLERREHEPAATLLAAARAAARINGRPSLQAMVDTWTARLATAQGDRAGALASLAQARQALTAPDERVRAQFALEEFRIALALQPAEASALIPRLPASTASRLLQARLRILQRQWAKAEQILEETEPVTIRERVEWAVLRSLAAQAPDLARAHRYLRMALALASPHRYLATIIEQGPGIAAVIRSLQAGPDLKPYIDELSVRAEAAGASPNGPAGLPPGGVLSDRELTVLRLLASRLTTTEIAGALFISANTLKSHMKSIYRKLDVNSRAITSGTCNRETLPPGANTWQMIEVRPYAAGNSADVYGTYVPIARSKRWQMRWGCHHRRSAVWRPRPHQAGRGRRGPRHHPRQAARQRHRPRRRSRAAAHPPPRPADGAAAARAQCRALAIEPAQRLPARRR